jgi:hypothetical protein
MDCIIEFQDPNSRLKFRLKEENQKIILETLLRFSKLTLSDLSSMLNTSTKLLIDVCNGKTFLKGPSSKNLSYLLFIFLNE